MPDKCETCVKVECRDRREDYGDVAMPWCLKFGCWLDLFEGYEPPCGGDFYEAERHELPHA